MYLYAVKSKNNISENADQINLKAAWKDIKVVCNSQNQRKSLIFKPQFLKAWLFKLLKSTIIELKTSSCDLFRYFLLFDSYLFFLNEGFEII